MILFNGKGLKLKPSEGHKTADSRHSLELLYQSYRVLKLLSEGECLTTLKSHKTPMEIPLPPCRLDNGHEFDWVRRAGSYRCGIKPSETCGREVRPSRSRCSYARRPWDHNAHAFMTGVADNASLKFTTDSAPEGVQLEQAPFIFISAVVIGDELYAYALRTTMTPHADDRGFVQWTSEKLEPLMIEQLGVNPSENYRLFAEKMVRISGIKIHPAKSSRRHIKPSVTPQLNNV